MPKNLKIKKGRTLIIPAGTSLIIPKEKADYDMSAIFPSKAAFENSVPDLVLNMNTKELSISNYAELKQIMDTADLGEKPQAYFQVGIVIAKHHRPKDRTALTDLNVANRTPKRASVCWAGTPVGTDPEDNHFKDAYDYIYFNGGFDNEHHSRGAELIQYLLNTGILCFNKKSDGNITQILNWIYPVPDRSYRKYRGQDYGEWDKRLDHARGHYYYFVGVVFRIRDPHNGKTYCKTQYSPKCVKVSYDEFSGVKTILSTDGYAITQADLDNA